MLYEVITGSLSIGRQAVTWGNGYVFNPMDLVNPFPPTDIERDYKIGSDMVIGLVNLGTSGDLQLVYVLHVVAARGVICYGDYQDNEPTFVRADAWIPKWKDLSQEEAEGKLLRKVSAGIRSSHLV